MAVLLSGCATTSAKQPPVAQLQTQVSDLQQRMETQEKEIVDLKYEVKEMGSKSEAQQVVTTEESAPAPTPTVSSKTGDRAADIIKVDASGVEVQKALKGAGLYEGKIDGKIGAKTKAAVVEFQKQHNLKADGVIGQKTWSELKQYVTE
jgi:peptidoglycan hydrolase-like protein with peptidoglycan-binding domain